MVPSSRRSRSLIGASALLWASCATVTDGQYWIRTELYFGTQVDGHGVVTDSDWKAFLAEVVTPRFPKGLTVLEGTGQWLGQQGPVHEQTHVLIVYHPWSAEINNAIEDIRRIYRDRFHQESVMRVSEHAIVAF